MDTHVLLSLLAASCGLLSLWIVGKNYKGWLVGICAQLLWCIYATTTAQYVLSIQSLIYASVFTRNFFVQRKKARQGNEAEKVQAPD